MSHSIPPPPFLPTCSLTLIVYMFQWTTQTWDRSYKRFYSVNFML